MSTLLENIINKSMSIDFDMSKSYSENINSSNLLNNNANLLTVPIEPVEASWKEVRYKSKTCLEKIYIFKNNKHIKYFLSEYFNSYEKLGYEPEIFIKGKKIKIYLGDLDFSNISEIDVEFSKYLDEIYEDIFYISGD